MHMMSASISGLELCITNRRSEQWLSVSAGAVAGAVAAPGYNFTLSPLPIGLVRRTPHSSGAAAAPQPKFYGFHTHDPSRLLRIARSIPTEEPTPEQIEAAVQAAVQYFDEEQLRYPCCSRDSRCSTCSAPRCGSLAPTAARPGPPTMPSIERDAMSRAPKNTDA